MTGHWLKIGETQRSKKNRRQLSKLTGGFSNLTGPLFKMVQFVLKVY